MIVFIVFIRHLTWEHVSEEDCLAPRSFRTAVQLYVALLNLCGQEALREPWLAWGPGGCSRQESHARACEAPCLAKARETGSEFWSYTYSSRKAMEPFLPQGQTQGEVLGYIRASR